MRVLGSYALVYVTSGRSEFGDDRGFRHTLRAGDAFLLFPDVAHFYDPGAGEPWDDIWFVFNGPVFDDWRNAGLLDPGDPVWHVEPVDYWRQRMAGVLTHGTGANAALVEVSRLLALMSEMRAERSGGYQANLQKEPWVKSARERLDRLEVDPNWARLSAEFGMTYEQFRKKFSAAVGMAPAQYRLTRRMEHAAARLRADDAPLKEIASELGFCDEFHFSKLFKRRTGLSPSAYRSQLRGAHSKRDMSGRTSSIPH